MKKILFVLQTLRSGGSVTSMLNLLSFLKERGVQADIFLLQREGVFLKRAESITKVLPEERIISSVLCPRHELKNRGVVAELIRVWFVLCCKMLGTSKAIELFYKASARTLSGKYDVVVAYQESLTTEYTQYIKASKKIAWVHNDYCRFAGKKLVKQEQKLYDSYNEIVCVSQASRKSMTENLNISANHIHVIYNTIPKESIVQQSEEKIEPLIKRKFTFISMGRFVEQKGFDRAVEVAFRLKKNNIDFIWYIIGNGVDFEQIEMKIINKQVEEHLILLGLRTNPFPYIKQADCFIMTSRYEAQPMVLNEALTLGIPVISTRFSSAIEVIDDGVNGLIVDNSEEGVYQGIKVYINDETLRKKISSGAKKFMYDNEKIINQVINLL